MPNVLEIFNWIIPITLVLSGLFIFRSSNPVYGVLSFIIVILHVVLILFLIEQDFLAILLGIVYIGAIVVLFLFVIMMFKIKKIVTYNKSFGSKLINGLVLLLLVTFLYNKETHLLYGVNPVVNSQEVFSDIVLRTDFIFVLANLIFDEFFILTLLMGIIMLVGIIGAIIIGRKNHQEAPLVNYDTLVKETAGKLSNKTLIEQRPSVSQEVSIKIRNTVRESIQKFK